MFGAFGAFFFADAWEASGFLDSNPLLSMGLLLVIAMLTSMGVAVLLERIAYRPLRNAPRLVPLITAIGASLFLANTARGFFGAQSRGFGVPSALEGTWTILGVSVDRIQVVVLAHRDHRRHRSVALRLADHDREVDARRRRRQRDREPDGDPRGPRDRHDVRDRWLAGGHRSRAVRDDVRVGELHDGLPSGDRGVHGGGPRRYRQHLGRRVGRGPARTPPVAGTRADPHGLRHPLVVPAQGRLHVPGPRPRPDLPARRAPRDRARRRRCDGRDLVAFDRAHGSSRRSRVHLRGAGRPVHEVRRPCPGGGADHARAGVARRAGARRCVRGDATEDRCGGATAGPVRERHERRGDHGTGRRRRLRRRDRLRGLVRSGPDPRGLRRRHRAAASTSSRSTRVSPPACRSSSDCALPAE